MTPVRRTPAESTALLLEDARHHGSPVMIPGAWEPRAVPPAVRATGFADPQPTVPAQTSVVSDRERLDREREGGGAASQRRRQASLLTKLWRTVRYPTTTGVIGSREQLLGGGSRLEAALASQR